MEAPNVRYTRTRDGRRIRYVTGGQGPMALSIPPVYGPPSTIVHRLGGLSECYDELFAGHSFIRFDFSYNGESVPPSIRELELDVEAASEVCAEPVDVLAWLHGCFPALSLAAQTPPSNWRSLALVTPGAVGHDYIKNVPLWTTRYWEDKATWTESLLRTFYDVSGDETEELAATWCREAPPFLGLDAVEEMDARDSLPLVPIPVLVLTGDFFRRESERVASLIPGARLAATDRMYHGAIQGRWLRSQIDQFLAGLEGDAARVPSVLSSRENEIVVHVAKGAANQGIADHLQISVRTVERHIQNVLNKLDLHNRVEIAYWAMRNGLLD